MSDRTVSDPAAPWQPGELTRELAPGAPPSRAPGAASGAQAQIDAIYADKSHPYHKGDPAAREEMRALFTNLSPPADPTWRDDALENPSPGDSRAPYLLSAPRPTEGPVPLAELRAISNVFDALAGGNKALAQQAYDFIEDGPADRLPEPPRTYQPPDPDQAEATLRQGWGDRYDDNLRLARAVAKAYDAMKGGGILDYLTQTGYGNDPRLIRLAARTGREWLKAGWRP